MRPHRDDTQLSVGPLCALLYPNKQQCFRGRVRGKLWRIDLNGLPTQERC